MTTSNLSEILRHPLNITNIEALTSHAVDHSGLFLHTFFFLKRKRICILMETQIDGKVKLASSGEPNQNC